MNLWVSKDHAISTSLYKPIGLLIAILTCDRIHLLTWPWRSPWWHINEEHRQCKNSDTIPWELTGFLTHHTTIIPLLECSFFTHTHTQYML